MDIALHVVSTAAGLVFAVLYAKVVHDWMRRSREKGREASLLLRTAAVLGFFVEWALAYYGVGTILLWLR